jgi:ribosomal protein S25
VSELSDNERGGLKSDLGLFHPGTDLSNNNYIYKSTSTLSRHRVLLLYDVIFQSQSLCQKDTGLFIEKRFQDIFQLFLNKISSKIIYALSMVRFSSYWELNKNLDINMGNLRRTISDLEESGIVKELQKDDQQYIPITRYWKNVYPTCPKIPILFMLSPGYVPIAELFQEDIYSLYISKREYNYLMRRKTEYIHYYERVKQELDIVRKREGQAIGRCLQCKKIIINTAIDDRDYHVFPKGLICNYCKRSATKEQLKQWLRQNE